MTISRNISRLLQYRQILIKLSDLGFESVFSYSLGKEAGVSAEQVRKDFSRFGIKGNRKGGYNISELIVTINDIFRKDELQKVILVGMGNIGMSMIKYRGFKRNMIEIVAAFDIDPVKIKKKNTIPVFGLDQLEPTIHKLGVKTAILAVPEQAAQELTGMLVDAGIIGILNFTPAVLKAPGHVLVSDIRIGNALETLIYQTSYPDNS